MKATYYDDDKLVILVSRVSFSPVLQLFFADSWNVIRLSNLAGRLFSAHAQARLLRWLVSLVAYDEALGMLSRSVQALDYELVVLTSTDALDRIKTRRAAVARLRQSIVSQFRNIDRAIILAYEKIAGASRVEFLEFPENTCEGLSTNSRDLTPRQLASTSVDREYAYIDKRAADLMPLLNENLQLVMAQLSVEQSQKATEQTAASHRLAELTVRDSAISIKNGERSTLLTLLAAVYLPLTLATGIFGMNIKDINSDTVRLWWPIIIAGVLMIPSGVVIGYIFWRGRKDRREAEDWLNKGDKLA